jgi:hypothetical protein
VGLGAWLRCDIAESLQKCHDVAISAARPEIEV